MTAVKWDDIGVRSTTGVCGIRREGEHWRFFDDAGDYPGKFADADAARWGCWVTAEDAEMINRERLITIEDARACLNKATAAFAAAQQALPTIAAAISPAKGSTVTIDLNSDQRRYLSGEQAK